MMETETNRLDELKASLAHLTRVEVPTPPMLEEALAYAGTARMVGYYWSPTADELVYQDGLTIFVGAYWPAWHVLLHSRIMRPLTHYNFGTSESEATRWLVIDRTERALYVGHPEDARRTIEIQHLHTPAAAQASLLEPDELMRSLNEAGYRLSQRPEYLTAEHDEGDQVRLRNLNQNLVRWLERQPMPAKGGKKDRPGFMRLAYSRRE